MRTHLRTIAERPVSVSRWNTVIQDSVKHGCFLESLHLYSSMVKTGLHEDHLTLPFVAKACASVRSLSDGKIVHARATLTGLRANVFVGTSLVDMYSKCGSLEEPRRLFDEMPVRSLVSWNSLISAYCKNSQTNAGLCLLREMRFSGVSPDSSTLACLVSGGCDVSVLPLHHCLSVHCCSIKLGFDSELIFSNSLICMYLRYGLLDRAVCLFNLLDQKSLPTWTAIIGGYLDFGDYANAFDTLKKLFRERIEADSILFVKLASACALSRSLPMACAVHSLIVKTSFDQEHIVGNSLVNLYAKCGDIKSAESIFTAIQVKDVYSWTSMISGYLHNGCSQKALNLFQKLLGESIEPTEVTAVTILSACANFGSLSMGDMAEKYVKAYGLDSDLRVQTALIDMYCRCASIDNAKRIFLLVQHKDLALWSTMLRGYAMHGMGREALALFETMQQKGHNIELDAIAFTTILSACSHSGLVEEGLHIFQKMKDFGVEPCAEHYSCLIDLLGRADQVNLATEIVRHVPFHLRNMVWHPLVSGCRDQYSLEQLELGRQFSIENQNAGTHVLLANAYASLEKWEKAVQTRRSMIKKGLTKEVGWSMVDATSSSHDVESPSFVQSAESMCWSKVLPKALHRESL